MTSFESPLPDAASSGAPDSAAPDTAPVEPPAPAPDELTRALASALRTAFEAFPTLVLDAEELATRMAPGLAATLGDAARAAGTSGSNLGRAIAGRASSTEHTQAAGPAAEERIIVALTRHASGRNPGVTPESLASLTGLSASVLGPAVSALVQSGDLVRDGWLVRLPQADDLLPARRQMEEQRSGELRHAGERRAIGDRRALGERRLYERRMME